MNHYVIAPTQMDEVSGGVSIDSCKLLSPGHYFGMQNPQSVTLPFGAQCMTLNQLPANLAQTGDDECEKRSDALGRPLGGVNRLAIYRIYSSNPFCN